MTLQIQDSTAEPSEAATALALPTAPRLFGNYAILVTSFLVGQVLGLLGLALVTRRVGPSGMGDYGYASNLAMYFALPLMPGFTLLGIRRLATAAPQARARVTAEIQVLYVANALAALMILTVFATLLTPNKQAAALTPILGLTLLLNAVSLEWGLQGLQRARLIGAFRLIGQFVYLLLILALLGLHDISVFGYAWANFAGLALTAVLECVTLWRIVGRPALRGRDRIFGEQGAVRRLLLTSAPLATSAVMLQVYYYSDVILLGQLSTSRQVGLYTIVGRIPLAMLTLASLWGTVFYPHAAQEWRRSPETLLLQARHFATLAIVLFIPAIPVAICVGPSLLRILFGPAFQAGEMTFVLLIAFAAVALVNVNISNLLLAARDDRGYVATVTGAAVLNVLLNIAFIPMWGATGSAAASLLAEIGSLGLATLRVRHITGVVVYPKVARLGGALKGLTVAWMAMVVGAHLPWPARAALVTAAYFSVVAATGAIRLLDFRIGGHTPLAG